MMIFRKAMPRRTFLRGLGTTLALPLLDGMVPAFAGALGSASKPPVRLSVVYVANGIIMDKWTPAKEGPDYELTPILEPLAAFRDRMLVLTGLEHKGGRHIRYAKDTPMPNLLVKILDTLDVHVPSLGDSTGKLDLISA